MTHDELLVNLDASLERTRQDMARQLGAPMVLAVEGLGCRIVPAWVVESLVKVLQGPTDKQAAQSNSETKEGG